MLRECGFSKIRRGTDSNFLNSYMAEFMLRSKLNNRDPLEMILKDVGEFVVSRKN